MNLLLDLSGVLVTLGGMPDVVRWTGKEKSEILSVWLASESARDLERGRVSFEQFHVSFTREWGIHIGCEELKASFESWVRFANPGALELLSQLKGRYKVSCLTNANCIQWPVVKEVLQIDEYFDHQFVSHELGMIKPDADIFHHAIEALNVQPGEILFADDCIENVATAKSLGTNSYHVNSVELLRKVLHGNGLLLNA